LDQSEVLVPMDGTGLSPAIERVLRHMEANFTEPLSLAELARLARLSTYRFAAVFRREVGVPPHQYLCRLRIAHAQGLLRQGSSPVDAAMESGFFDQSHLSRHFKRLCGTTPGRYAANAC
jgi:transcriptional regulator GlxA family with amidase domain